VTTLEEAAALARNERGLVIVATLRGDGTIQSSLVNAGIVPQPDTGESTPAHEAALQALVSTGDIVGWREFVIQAFQSRSCETGYLPASLWGELASESNEHQDIIRTMYVRWGLALSQSVERSIPTNRFCDYQTYPCLASPHRPCCMADSVSAQFTETSAHSRKRWRSCFRSDHPM
jgi:hypothetical protein